MTRDDDFVRVTIPRDMAEKIDTVIEKDVAIRSRAEFIRQSVRLMLRALGFDTVVSGGNEDE